MAETVHYVPKCISCHKAIVMIIGRADYFHDYIYIYNSQTSLSIKRIRKFVKCFFVNVNTKRMLSVHHIHHDVPKFASCHKAIVAMTEGRGHFFPDHAFVNPIWLLWNLRSLSIYLTFLWLVKFVQIWYLPLPAIHFPGTTKRLAKIMLDMAFTLLPICSLKKFFEQIKLQLLKKCKIFFIIPDFISNKIHKGKVETKN